MRPLVLFVFALTLSAQSPKDVRAVAKGGSSAIPTVAQYLNSTSVDTRVETIRQLTAIGGKDTIDPLIRGTEDTSAEVQINATDGLVNYYLPGYVRVGLGSSIIRAGAAVKSKFSDTNDQTIDLYVTVRPDVISALGKLARGGASMDSRANACRAIGILRGSAAVPDLLDALRTKDNRVMYESLIAIQKIRAVEAGPRIAYLVRDLDDKVQSAAIETVGLLRAKDALPALRGITGHPRNTRAERSALSAIALMPEAIDEALFQRYIESKDDKLRAAACEGEGRLGRPGAQPALTKTWKEDDKMLPRLAAAFGLVMQGDASMADEAPLRYLVNTLNSAAYREVAAAYLIEAAPARQAVRDALYQPLEQGTRGERIEIAKILAISGDNSAAAHLERMSRDSDGDVAQEGLRALRSLRARTKI